MDLFDNLPLPEATSKPRVRPKMPETAVPVITSGLFELADTVSPERYAAVYLSGATAHYDAVGLTSEGKDIGVVATLIRPRTMYVLRQYLAGGGKIFCDSGAFGQFKAWQKGKASSPALDFYKVFAVYNALLEGLPDSVRFNLTIVMPDVLTRMDQSLDLLREHRDRVKGYIASGANVIVPLQMGEQSAGKTAEIIFDILESRNITFGIPSAAAAMSLPDAATIRHNRFHILGRGSFGMPLFQRTYALLEHNPGAYVSCDATQIRKHTAVISFEQEELIRQNENSLWTGEYDDTELIGEIMNATGWLSTKQVTALANFYGVTDPAEVKCWIKAHKSGENGLAPMIEARDPEAMHLYAYGIARVFREAAEKHLSARMRAPAVARVFGGDSSLSAVTPCEV